MSSDTFDGVYAHVRLVIRIKINLRHDTLIIAVEHDSHTLPNSQYSHYSVGEQVP